MDLRVPAAWVSVTSLALSTECQSNKGSITTPNEFVQPGWCTEKNKVFTLVDPSNFARDWQGKDGFKSEMQHPVVNE
jgi:hypothetical protein